MRKHKQIPNQLTGGIDTLLFADHAPLFKNHVHRIWSLGELKQSLGGYSDTVLIEIGRIAIRGFYNEKT